MKIQLTYDRLSQIKTDLLVVILDDERTFHDLSASPLQERVRSVQRDFKDKKLKTEYFTALEGKTGPKNLVVFSTSLSKAYQRLGKPEDLSSQNPSRWLSNADWSTSPSR